MITDALIVERVWSYPPVLPAFFLEKCAIYLQIRNKSGKAVQIEKVECRFETDDGVEPYIPAITPLLTLEHEHLSPPIRVEFDAHLSFKANTNCYRIIINYRNDETKTFEHDPRKFLIFNPQGPCEKHFFISHKDPEDFNIASKLVHFLKKVGFSGYLSENDHGPGIDIWAEKIPSAIQSSVGVIILWTSRAARDPLYIKREIKIAKSYKKPLILAREQRVRIPKIFPKKKIEYYQLQNPISSSQLIHLVCSIENTNRRGGYS